MGRAWFVLLFGLIAACTSSAKESVDASVVDQGVADLHRRFADAVVCTSGVAPVDPQRMCLGDVAFIPVCFLGPVDGLGIVTVCIISPDGHFYYYGEGNQQKPYSDEPGWRFRVSSGGSAVATDGSMLSPSEVAACDRLLLPIDTLCSACDDLGCR